jgi:hypothetical protein
VRPGLHCAGSKAVAAAAFNGGRIERFGANKSRFPQGCTDYERWKAAKQQYSITYCNRWAEMLGTAAE